MLLDLIKQRQINGKLSDYDIKLLKYIEESKSVKICKEDHPFGYAPHVKNGTCRFCWGVKDRNLSELVEDFNKIN